MMAILRGIELGRGWRVRTCYRVTCYMVILSVQSVAIAKHTQVNMLILPPHTFKW